MEKKIINIKIIALLTFVTFALESSFAISSESNLLVQVYSDKCRHGLHPQPQGRFSVFLFCDDALGSNIGIIMTERGIPPMDIIEKRWGTIKRFWQMKPWAADVTSFAWSPDGNYLFVATSGIYGDGGLYKLDLNDQSFERLFPDDFAEYMKKDKYLGYYTKIESINVEERDMVISVYAYYSNGENKLLKRQLIKLISVKE